MIFTIRFFWWAVVVSRRTAKGHAQPFLGAPDFFVQAIASEPARLNEEDDARALRLAALDEWKRRTAP